MAEALGLALPHSALAPSGQPIWRDMARRSARAVTTLRQRGVVVSDVLNDASVRNAMVVHAAFGGSTNLLLHLPAVAYAAGVRRPGVEDWAEVNRSVPRLVDVLPNGPIGHPTVRVFMAGGVPEVMLHLRRMGLLDTSVLTAGGETLERVLDWWENSERRVKLRRELKQKDGVDSDDVIFDPSRARCRGLTSTITFCHGNLAPEGAVVKSTAIDSNVVDADGVYRNTGPARVFLREADAMAAIKNDSIRPGDIMVLICCGPMGSGMEEIYQITSALKHLPSGNQVAVITDARFSGVSTGACIGHVGPEALAGGPLGKLLDGDQIRIVIDRNQLRGSLDLVGEKAQNLEEAVSEVEVLDQDSKKGSEILARREMRSDLIANPKMPDDTRLWAALQHVSGGTWGGCVFDVDRIVKVLEAG